MGNLIDILSQILEKTGSLFGILALIAVIPACAGFFLFRNAGTKQRERVFICLTLFFLGLVFSSLTAGIFSGFEKGGEVATAQVEGDPLQVKLSPAIVEKLEDHIASNGEVITDEGKVQILSAALEVYLASPETSSPELISSSLSTSPQSYSNADTSQESFVGDFRFELQGCIRADEKIACDFWVTNKEQDEKLRLYANYLATASRITTPQGSQFIANQVEFGGYESTSYVDVNLVQEVGVTAEVGFESVPQDISQLALIELSVSARHSGAFTVQFRNIPISN